MEFVPVIRLPEMLFQDLKECCTQRVAKVEVDSDNKESPHLQIEDETTLENNLAISEKRIAHEDLVVHVYKRYSQTIETIVDAFARKHGEKVSKPKSKIELTFGSFMIEDILPKLINKYRDQVEFWVGTVLTAKEADILLQMGIGDTQVYALSPVFDPEVAGMLAGTNFVYVPGCFNLGGYEAIVSFYQKKNLKLEFLKIFPFVVESSEGLFKALCGPFPELAGNDKLESLNKENCVQISNAQDYFNIRNKFLIDLDARLVFSLSGLDQCSVDSKNIFGLELAKLIKKQNPQMKIFASGLGDIDVPKLESLDYYGTNIIKGQHFKLSFEGELKKVIKKLAKS